MLELLEKLAAEMAGMRAEMARMATQINEAERPISETELRKRFQCSYETIRRARVRGLLRGRQIGHNRFYTPQAVNDWINADLGAAKLAKQAERQKRRIS